MNDFYVYTVGLISQILFSARMVVQWVASERAKKVLSPVIFWQLSMLASFMMCVYGWLRHDFALIAGQLIAYYIYIWNLNIKGSWKEIPRGLRILFLYVPLCALLYLVGDGKDTMKYLFEQEDIPLWLILFGSAGQFLFTLRFVYQWWYSSRRGESLLPITFWIISVTGSLMIISYAILRKDIVLMLGQSTGFVVYVRNIMIALKSPDTTASDR